MKLYAPCPKCNTVCETHADYEIVTIRDDDGHGGRVEGHAQFRCTKCPDTTFCVECYVEIETAKKKGLEKRVRECLIEIKEDQESKDPVIKQCPRCGNAMEWPLCRNALSRREDVYVCSRCGDEEAMLEAARQPLHVTVWAIAGVLSDGDA